MAHIYLGVLPDFFKVCKEDTYILSQSELDFWLIKNILLLGPRLGGDIWN